MWTVLVSTVDTSSTPASADLTSGDPEAWLCANDWVTWSAVTRASLCSFTVYPEPSAVIVAICPTVGYTVPTATAATVESSVAVGSVVSGVASAPISTSRDGVRCQPNVTAPTARPAAPSSTPTTTGIRLHFI